MKQITDRLRMVGLGLFVIIAGLYSPKLVDRALFDVEEPEDPIKIRERHREMFLAQHREMTGEQ